MGFGTVKILTAIERQDVVDSLARDGFAVVREALDPSSCASVGRDVIAEYDRLISLGWKFAAGGRMARHLAINFGPHGPHIVSALREGGYVSAAEQSIGHPLSVIVCVGNMNLPGSVSQEMHQDPTPDDDFFVFNVMLSNATAESGPMEIVPGSQGKRYSYNTLFASGAISQRVAITGRPGDVLIRRGSTWHRGSANKSVTPRPMFGVIMKPLTPPVPDPACEDERIGFRANRFYGRGAWFREVLQVHGAPVVHAIRRARSRR